MRFFWVGHFGFFFSKKKIFFCLMPWKIVKGSWTARMGRNFVDYSGFQPFRSWANTYAQDCMIKNIQTCSFPRAVSRLGLSYTASYTNITLNTNLNCLVCSQMNPKVPTTRQFAHDAFFTMAASLQAAAVEIGLCWAWSNGYLPMRDYSYFTSVKREGG